MATPRPLRAIALRALIVSVALSTALGAIAFFAVESKGMQKVLVTSLCGSGASVFVFLGVSGIGRRGVRGWCVLTAAAGLLGFGLLLVGSWTEMGSRSLWRVASSCVVIAAASGYIVILSAARLRPGHRWAAFLACVLAAVFAALLLVNTWTRRVGEDLARLTGTVGVLLAGSTLLVPILARMAQAQGELARAGLGARARYCPACGHGLEHEGAPLTCGACGRSFRVTFEGEDASPFQ